MASNPTPDDDDVLLALAEDMADGCNLHEVEIGIKQNTEAVMRAAITAATAGITGLAAARLAVVQKTEDRRTVDAAGTVVLKNCRLRLVKLYGGQFDANWNLAGWPGQSTSIPDSMDQRFTLLNSLKNFFTSNAAAESADMEATAAICGTAHANLSNARSALNVAETGEVTANNTMKASVKALRKRVRGLIEELDKLISDEDPRWEGFGLNIPANPSAPEGIASLTAEASGNGKIHLEWVYATRMTGTRLLTKRTTGATIDDDFISAGTAEGLEKTLPGFVAGVTVEVMVIPYNDGGDGPASPVASVVVS